MLKKPCYLLFLESYKYFKNILKYNYFDFRLGLIYEYELCVLTCTFQFVNKNLQIVILVSGDFSSKADNVDRCCRSSLPKSRLQFFNEEGFLH